MLWELASRDTERSTCMHSAKGDIPASLLVICVTLDLTFHFWSPVFPSVKGAAVLTPTTEEELDKWERRISATEW